MSGEYDEDLARWFYANLPTEISVKSEQVFADATRNLDIMVNNLRTDVESREQATGIIDDSAEFVILHMRMMALINRTDEDRKIATGLLAAAIYRLARVPRAILNPLAHLEDEGN
jgi:hypothetical protein